METPRLFPKYGSGRCINCGFLTYRRAARNAADFNEVTSEMRLTAYFEGGEIHCFVNAASFINDIGDLGADAAALSQEQCKGLIDKDRRCEKWYQWREGLDPRWHFEELNMLQLEERRQEFEKLTELQRRMFESSIDVERRHFEERLAQRAEESEEKRHNLVIWVALAAAILVVVEIAAAILGAGPGSLIGKLFGLE